MYVMIFLKFFSDLKVLKSTYTCTRARTHTHTLKKKDRTWNISSELTTGGYMLTLGISSSSLEWATNFH